MPVTIRDIRAELNPIARMTLAYGLLEGILKTVDGVDSFESVGERMQQQEELLGLELLRNVNFALGVRNRLMHPTGNEIPTTSELSVAADYFLLGIERHLSLLSDCEKEKVTGAQPPKKSAAKRNETNRPLRDLKDRSNIEFEARNLFFQVQNTEASLATAPTADEICRQLRLPQTKAGAMGEYLRLVMKKDRTMTEEEWFQKNRQITLEKMARPKLTKREKAQEKAKTATTVIVKDVAWWHVVVAAILAAFAAAVFTRIF